MLLRGMIGTLQEAELKWHDSGLTATNPIPDIQNIAPQRGVRAPVIAMQEAKQLYLFTKCIP